MSSYVYNPNRSVENLTVPSVQVGSIPIGNGLGAQQTILTVPSVPVSSIPMGYGPGAQQVGSTIPLNNMSSPYIPQPYLAETTKINTDYEDQARLQKIEATYQALEDQARFSKMEATSPALESRVSPPMATMPIDPNTPPTTVDTATTQDPKYKNACKSTVPILCGARTPQGGYCRRNEHDCNFHNWASKSKGKKDDYIYQDKEMKQGDEYLYKPKYNLPSSRTPPIYGTKNMKEDDVEIVKNKYLKYKEKYTALKREIEELEGGTRVGPSPSSSRPLSDIENSLISALVYNNKNDSFEAATTLSQTVKRGASSVYILHEVYIHPKHGLTQTPLTKERALILINKITHEDPANPSLCIIKDKHDIRLTFINKSVPIQSIDCVLIYLIMNKIRTLVK